MPDVPTRREYLTMLGAGSATVLAGCSKSDLLSPSLTDGTISEQSLPPFAGIVPDIDPLVLAGWNTGGQTIRVTDYPDTPTDTLRFNAIGGGLPPAAMGVYLLTSEVGTFVSQLWLSQLEANNEPDWMGVVADIWVMYGPDVEIQTARESLSTSESSYETIVDEQNQLVVRGPEGDVVGVTPTLFAFVPASQGEFPFSPVKRVRALVNTALGNRTPLPDRDAPLREALRHTPSTGIVHVAHSQDVALGDAMDSHREMDTPVSGFTGSATGYSAARTAVSHIDVSSDDKPSPATGTLVYDETSAIDGETLTDRVGNLGNKRTYVQDGTMVQVNCEYTSDALSPLLASNPMN